MMNSRLSEAIGLKTSLIQYLDKKFQDTSMTDVSLDDLIQFVSSSPYNYFLRDVFKIDSRSLAKRVHMFLLTYPDKFVVKNETRTVRLTTALEETAEHLNSTLITRCLDFLILCLSLKPEFLIQIKQLYGYLKYAALDIEKYFTDEQIFHEFLKQHDEHFHLDGDHVAGVENYQKLTRRNLKMNKINETPLEEGVLANTVFIYNLKTGLRLLEYIKSKVKIIALDSEGTHLGDPGGVLTLVQIAFVERSIDDLKQSTILKNSKIYLLDILSCEELMYQCVAPILADKNVTKIMHDHKNDVNAFRNYYGLKEICNVFDTSSCYFKLTDSCTNGLHTIYEEITGLSNQNLKPKMRKLYQVNFRLWESRPLSPFLKFYAAFDVLCLISIYLHLNQKYKLDQRIFIEKLNLEEPEIVGTLEIDHPDGRKQIGENVIEKKKKTPHHPHIRESCRKTPEEIELLRRKIEHLEKIARGEIESTS